MLYESFLFDTISLRNGFLIGLKGNRQYKVRLCTYLLTLACYVIHTNFRLYADDGIVYVLFTSINPSDGHVLQNDHDEQRQRGRVVVEHGHEVVP